MPIISDKSSRCIQLCPQGLGGKNISKWCYTEIFILNSDYLGTTELVPNDGLCVNVKPAPIAVAFPVEDAHECGFWLAIFWQDMERADHQSCLQEALQKATKAFAQSWANGSYQHMLNFYTKAKNRKAVQASL